MGSSSEESIKLFSDKNVKSVIKKALEGKKITQKECYKVINSVRQNPQNKSVLLECFNLLKYSLIISEAKQPKRKKWYDKIKRLFSKSSTKEEKNDISYLIDQLNGLSKKEDVDKKENVPNIFCNNKNLSKGKGKLLDNILENPEEVKKMFNENLARYSIYVDMADKICDKIIDFVIGCDKKNLTKDIVTQYTILAKELSFGQFAASHSKLCDLTDYILEKTTFKNLNKEACNNLLSILPDLYCEKSPEYIYLTNEIKKDTNKEFSKGESCSEKVASHASIMSIVIKKVDSSNRAIEQSIN